MRKVPKMLLTKEVLALYSRVAAPEDGAISSATDAAILNQKLDSWDIEPRAPAIRQLFSMRTYLDRRLAPAVFEAQ